MVVFLYTEFHNLFAWRKYTLLLNIFIFCCKFGPAFFQFCVKLTISSMNARIDWCRQVLLLWNFGRCYKPSPKMDDTSHTILYLNTDSKNEVSIKGFFSICDQIRRFQRIWSHLLKKSLTENFIFRAVF